MPVNSRYLLFHPCPKSPHGCDVDPTGEYIVGSGKLAALIPVFSFDKIQQAIAAKDYAGEYDGIPVIKYESACMAKCRNRLGPLHTEFDGKGNAYTSFFVSSEVVKWNIKDLKVVTVFRPIIPLVTSVYRAVIRANPSANTLSLQQDHQDRFPPTGLELAQSAQLYDISGDKMQLILDFRRLGKPHYAQAFAGRPHHQNSVKFFKIEDNSHPLHCQGEGEKQGGTRRKQSARVHDGDPLSHFSPDNIEGIRLGDEVYFHVTNQEQDWDVPHGLREAANNAELLIMPGETTTLKWVPDRVGMFPMYCTDFCSALHQEMQGYAVSPAGSNVPLLFSTGKTSRRTTPPPRNRIHFPRPPRTSAAAGHPKRLL